MPDDLKAHEPQRVAFYQAVAGLLRAFANIADDLTNAGYTEAGIQQIKFEVEDKVKVRESIRKAAGETIDLKAYEADMRHLIDTYIEAGEPRVISDFGEMGLLDVIVQSGMADAISSLPDGIKNDKGAVAETIANNVRSKILKEHLNDPVFYDKMSALLKEILADLKARRIDYEEFLKRIAEVAKQVQAGKSDDTPAKLDTPGKRALYNNLKPAPTPYAAEPIHEGDGDPTLQLALEIDRKVKQVRPAGWRGNKPRENIIKAALLPLVGNDKLAVEKIFLILTAQQEY